MKFEIKNRWDSSVIFTAEIECSEDTGYSIKLGLAVKAAVKARANLAGAYLAGANLAGANLAGANLADAYLAGANLAGANLADANLAGANLAGANLARANLARANLAGANLADANLAGANLADAYLADAYLARANLARAKNAEAVIARTRILPEGTLIGWKKCQGNVLVKLRIPEEARRSHAFGRKCRAEFVDVLEVIGSGIGHSRHDNGETQYRVGERVTCHQWEEDWQQECAGGIHFFITRSEAEDW